MFVVGDFDLDEVEKDISQVCGSWSGGDYIKPDLGKGAFVPNERRDKVMLRDQVILMYGRPSPLTLAHPDRIPLKLLNNICFDGLGSRLGKLRERTGLFYGASGALAARLTKVHGYDFIGAMLSVDRVKEAQEKMLEVVDEMGKNGVAQSELEEARQYYLNGLINHTATIGGVAGSFSFIEEYNLPTDYFDKSAERVQSITRKEVNQIAKRYFNSKDLARVRVGRIDAIRGANPEKDSSNRVAGEQSKTN
jgi:zinc protease